MKLIIQKLWILIAMLWISISSSAYDFEVDGIYYNILSPGDLTCEVTYNPANESSIVVSLTYPNGGGEAAGQRLSAACWPSYQGDLIIPQKVSYKGRDFTVTKIGEAAFLGCDLSSISLPSTITSMEDYTVYRNGAYGTFYTAPFDYSGISKITVGNAYILNQLAKSYTQGGDKPYLKVRELILSEDFTGEIEINFKDFRNIEMINANSIIPPCFDSTNPFSFNQQLNLPVLVKPDIIDLYKSSPVWNEMWELTSTTPTEISSLQPYDFFIDGIYFDAISIKDLTCEVTYNPANESSIVVSLTYPNGGGEAAGQRLSATCWPSYQGDLIIPQKVSYKGRDFTVTKIGEAAFLGCDLSSISLPSTITSMEDYTVYRNGAYGTFYTAPFDYSGISKITVGNAYILNQLAKSYTQGEHKPYYQIEKITLSEQFIEDIQVDFSNFNSLSELCSKTINPPIFSNGNHFLPMQFLNLPVFVPANSLTIYQSAEVWKDFWELKAIKPVNSITLNEEIVNLEPYETSQLIATVLPEDAYDSSVNWKSSNPGVASVDSNGLITAVTKGDAVITVSSTDGSNITAECSVHVDLLVKDISLSETEIGLEPGNSKQLQVIISPKDAFMQDVVWSSDNEEIATVDELGNITAHKVGVTNIVVKTTDGSNLSATCKVIVANLVKSILVTPKRATLKEGESLQLSASVTPENATYKDIIWSSDNYDVASVNTAGEVTAVSAGTTLIKATASDGTFVFGQCEINVTAETVEYEGVRYQRNSLSTLKIVANPNNPYSGDFFVPESAVFKDSELLVTEIGENAFEDCSELTSIVIPNTITKVSESAFKGCSKLSFVKFCDGSLIDCNLDLIFPVSPIEDLYIGGNGFTYDSDSRLLKVVKSMMLGGSVTNLPPMEIFKTLNSFIVEDGVDPIVEPDNYCSRSMELITQQTLKDPNTYIYYRYFYLVTYTHLSPILNALQNSTLNYLHIGREVQQVEVDTSMTQEIIPTTAGNRYQEFGYKDEVNYQYQEIIVKNDYNRNPVESISINESIVELNIGESKMLSVVCLPANASLTAVEWSSSNEEVAIVDIFGNVTKLTDGEAVITATTTDGSNLSSTCKIVNQGDGVEVIVDPSDNGVYSVYNLQGIKILESEDVDKVKLLPSGVYIVNGKKLIIK